MTDRRAIADLPWLPAMLRSLAEEFGVGAALSLAMEYGGRSIYLPKKATSDHPVAMLIGLPAMKALCSRYGGHDVDIPLGINGQLRKLARQISQLDDGKKSANQIARTAGCAERTVFNHRRKRRDGTGMDNRQLKLV